MAAPHSSKSKNLRENVITSKDKKNRCFPNVEFIHRSHLSGFHSMSSFPPPRPVPRPTLLDVSTSCNHVSPNTRGDVPAHGSCIEETYFLLGYHPVFSGVRAHFSLSALNFQVIRQIVAITPPAMSVLPFQLFG